MNNQNIEKMSVALYILFGSGAVLFGVAAYLENAEWLDVGDQLTGIFLAFTILQKQSRVAAIASLLFCGISLTANSGLVFGFEEYLWEVTYSRDLAFVGLFETLIAAYFFARLSSWTFEFHKSKKSKTEWRNTAVLTTVIIAYVVCLFVLWGMASEIDGIDLTEDQITTVGTCFIVIVLFLGCWRKLPGTRRLPTIASGEIVQDEAIKKSSWDQYPKLLEYYHREATVKKLNETEIMVAPNGRFGQGYVMDKERLEDYRDWLSKKIKGKYNHYIYVMVLVPIASVFTPDLETPWFEALISVLLLFCVVSVYLSAKKITRLFRAKFPEAIPTKGKVARPAGDFWLLLSANPICSPWVVGICVSIGLWALWETSAALRGDLDHMLMFFGLHLFLMPLIVGMPLYTQVVRYQFRKKHGIRLTPGSLMELEFETSVDHF